MKALEIKNLHKTYKNGFEALKGIDLSIEEGDFFALLGPNGAGKSTTIGLISHLVTNNTGGEIKIFGHDLDQEASLVKAMIGVVPQEFNFNPFFQVEVVVKNQGGLYGLNTKESTKRAKQLLTALGLWDKRKESLMNLSGGMKRRVLIAKALMHKPKLLILDEPTAGVDIELRRSMWEFLKKINAEGTTIILTTHYLEEAEQLCRNIAIIDKGYIIENTDKKTLLAKLKCQSLVLDLKEPISVLPEIESYQVKLIDSMTIEVVVKSDQTINGLFELLSKHNMQVSSFTNKASRLEELFISLVDSTSTLLQQESE